MIVAIRCTSFYVFYSWQYTNVHSMVVNCDTFCGTGFGLQVKITVHNRLQFFHRSSSCCYCHHAVLQVSSHFGFLFYIALTPSLLPWSFLTKTCCQWPFVHNAKLHGPCVRKSYVAARWHIALGTVRKMFLGHMGEGIRSRRRGDMFLSRWYNFISFEPG